MVKTDTKKIEVDSIHSIIYCDKCNCIIRDSDKPDKSLCDAFACEIEMQTGLGCSDGGSGKRYSVDLCPKCMEAFIEDIKKIGYRVNISDWNK